MATFPNDQFDHIPANIDRVGAHRGPKVRGRGWITFLWALLAVVVLTGAGVFVLKAQDGSINFTGNVPVESNTPTASPTPTISPITDPTTIAARHITITVLNGTTTAGLATHASQTLKALKWNVTSTAEASETTIKQTVVYYSVAANKDVALGIAKALGKTTVALTDVYPTTSVTVVLGSDYAK
jgi:hypothetical protein